MIDIFFKLFANLASGTKKGPGLQNFNPHYDLLGARAS